MLEFTGTPDGELGCDSDLQYHMLLLQFYRRSTVDVISLYNLYGDEANPDDPDNQMKIMLLRLLQLRTPHDRLAAEFVKTQSKCDPDNDSTPHIDIISINNEDSSPLEQASGPMEIIGSIASLAKKQAGRFASLFKKGK